MHKLQTSYFFFFYKNNFKFYKLIKLTNFKTFFINLKNLSFLNLFVVTSIQVYISLLLTDLN